jgi:hypothetical protein
MRLSVIFIFLVCIFLLIGCGGGENTVAEASAGMWLAPEGSADCWKCHTATNTGQNGNACANGCGFIPVEFVREDGAIYTCTEEMCTSLGKDCAYEETQDEGDICIERPAYQIGGPRIEYVAHNYECNKQAPGQVGGCKETKTSDSFIISGLVEEFTDVNFTFRTVDEKGNAYPSTCYYTNDPKILFDEVRNKEYLDLGNRVEHNFMMPFPMPKEEPYNYYFICEDSDGNRGSTYYTFRFDVATLPDRVDPVILEIIPNDGLFKHNETDPYLEMIVNEPVFSCGWASDELKVEFDLMNKDFDSCLPFGADSMKYRCLGNIEGVTKEIQEYYFKCEDYNGNIGPGGSGESYYVSFTDELTIVGAECPHFEGDDCSGDIYEPVINLTLFTNGGVENGKAVCEYLYGNSWNEFFETDTYGSSYQPMINLKPGDNPFKFRCVDSAGNYAEFETSLNYIKDIHAPVLEKVYLENGLLMVDTDEESTCRYVVNGVFDVVNATEMSTANKLIHSTTYSQNSYFIVECRDRFNNRVGPVNLTLIKGEE